MTARMLAFSLFVYAVFAAADSPGRRAPGFALPDSNYEHFYDLQDFKGQVLLIDIMSTTCPHCMLLSTTLEAMKERFGDRLQVLSVVLPPDNPDTVRKYMAVNKITSPVVFDQGQMTISYLNAKPGQGHIDVPHLFLIDGQGMIRKDWDYTEGNRTVFEGPGLAAEIEKLLRK